MSINNITSDSCNSFFERDRSFEPGIVTKIAMDIFSSKKDLLANLGFSDKKVDLGGGSCSKVYKIFNKKEEDKPYVLKDITLKLTERNKEFLKISLNNEGIIRGEALALSLPEHPNLLKTHGCIVFDENSEKYEYVKYLNLLKKEGLYVVGTITEYLADFVNFGDFLKAPDKKLSIDEFKKIGRQIVSVLQNIHQKGFIHRDVKVENILIHYKDFTIKLIDFGFMRRLNKGEQKRPSTPCGSYVTAAKEVYCPKEGHDQRADLWSLGVVFYYMAFKTYPSYYNDDVKQFKQNVSNLTFTNEGLFDIENERQHLKTKKVLSSQNPFLEKKEFWDLISHLICPEEKRLYSEDVLSTDFFTEEKNG